MEIPTHLKHKPIIGVDYSKQDANAGDAKFLSVGIAQWNAENGMDISAKVFRRGENGFSRQSEELPLWRVLDLATLVVGVITGQRTSLGETDVDTGKLELLAGFIDENMELYIPRIRELRRLLNNGRPKTAPDSSPNLFSFATSELSQDAFFAWLIQWADDRNLNTDNALCRLGKSFVSSLTGIQPKDIHKIEVGRQWKSIDIWATVNDDAFLIIEDKTGTSVHDDQLNRYKAIVEKEYGGSRELHYAYIKTENEPKSSSAAIAADGYLVVRRKGLLEILDTYDGNDRIVQDYRARLRYLENECGRFWAEPVSAWGWYAWQGFYSELEKHIDVESWSYIANPSGGFLGLWWHFVSDGEARMYLQFEQRKLCVKIECLGDTDRPATRRKYHNLLIEKAEKRQVPVERPERFGTGTYMTIGVIPEKTVFGEALLDIEVVVSRLKEFEELIDEIMKQ